MRIRDYIAVALRNRPQATAIRFFAAGAWRARSYAEFADRIVKVSAMVSGLELEPGRHNVALMLDNCPEWEEIYLGLVCVGFTVVPIDPKLKDREVHYILSDSGATCIFAGAKQTEVVAAAAAGLESLRFCVTVGGEAPAGKADDGLRHLSYEATLGTAAPDAAARDYYAGHAPAASDVASLIYTSGTTGSPKGVMLSHANITANVNAAVEVEAFKTDDVFLVALPLFHAFSFAFSFMLAIASGGCGCFIRSLRTISEDIRIYHPTTILAVPLMAEKMYAKIEEKLAASKMVKVLRALGLDFVVGRAVRKALGGRVRRMAIGGAPTSVKVLEGYAKYGVPAKEGYGLTECSPLVSWPGVGHECRFGTVGLVLPSMRYKIVDKDATGAGELCVKGPNVTSGYYKNETATKAAFDPEGYFLTGDIVREDADGYITICGRKKALIVNREGKNIYPEEIEQLVDRCEYVAMSLSLGFKVEGEVGEHVGLVVQANDEACESLGATPEARDAALRDAVMAICLKGLAEYKVPRKLVIRHEPFSLTSTMKVRRSDYVGSLDETKG